MARQSAILSPQWPCQPKGSIVEEDQTGRREALAEKVERLKRERDAVVLAHYYVPAETQRLADYVGDSFYLARLAKTLDAPIIVLCGVSFMAESVKLLNPARRVLMPEPAADCPMAHMVRQEDVDRVRAEVPDLAVVAYVNTTAKIGLAQVEALELAHPDALILAHPECTREVLDEADFIGSTKQIIERVATGEEREFIVLTVVGVADQIERRTEGQGKRIYFPEPAPACPNMAMVTPEKLLACLENMAGEVALPAEPQRAVKPLERMLELAGR